MPAHVIRLAGPWRVQPIPTPSAPEGFAESQSVRMPLDWQSLFGTVAGRAQFTRTFHAPTGLHSGEQVLLECTGVRGTGAVWLNATEIGMIDGRAAAVRFNITAALRPFNTLVIELEFDPAATADPGGLFDVVRLVIESD